MMLFVVFIVPDRHASARANVVSACASFQASARICFISMRGNRSSIARESTFLIFLSHCLKCLHAQPMSSFAPLRLLMVGAPSRWARVVPSLGILASPLSGVVPTPPAIGGIYLLRLYSTSAEGL